MQCSLVGQFPSQDCFPETGFWTYCTDDLYFVIKAGQIAPNHIPAHAHADLLSYELSIAVGTNCGECRSF